MYKNQNGSDKNQNGDRNVNEKKDFHLTPTTKSDPFEYPYGIVS